MTARTRPNRGLVGRSDLIELLPDDEGSLKEFAGIAEALGFELSPESALEKSYKQNPPDSGSNNTEAREGENLNGWTTFEPAPTQYWRVTGFKSKLSDQKAKDGEGESKQIARGRSPAEILKAAAFDAAKSLSAQPLAARNYLLTKLRAIAPTRSSASQLDIPKAVDRISRGEFLTSVPRNQRRVWGHNICVIQDRARRLVPYWFDEDQVSQIVIEIYPECSVEVARFHDGHSRPEYCFPTSLVGLDWQPPTPGTLVLALTDLGALARGDKEHHESIWLRFGDLLRKNGNPAIALVPLHTNALSDLLQQRWQTIHWQQTNQHCDSEAMDLKVDRLLEFLAPCIRLEPQLLRAVRLLNRECQSYPELESFVWQHSLLNSQHSVAGPVNATMREALLAKFATLDRGLRRQILETLLAKRQTLHPAVHFEEIVSLDEESRGIVNAELLELAEAYYSALAEAGDDKLNAGTLAWIDRCARRLPKKSALPARLSQAMLTLVKKTQISEISDAPRWMVDAIPTATEAKSELRVDQRGANLVLRHSGSQQVPDTIVDATKLSRYGSLLGTIRCAERVVWIHKQRSIEVALNPGLATVGVRNSSMHSPNDTLPGPILEFTQGEELNAAKFWTGGMKPSWVYRFGTDEFGPWCSIRVKDVEQVLRWIPAGSFAMGTPRNEKGRDQNEEPQRRATITGGFWIFDTPCTQDLWFALMGTDLSQFKGGSRPVDSTSWYDAKSFAERLSVLLPKANIGLPDSAEWEYACRGTGLNRRFARYGSIDEIAWFADNSGNKTHDVRQLKPNEYGLYDMLGNVWEWCEDEYQQESAHSTKTRLSSQQDHSDAFRVIRGGAWHTSANDVRAGYHRATRANVRNGNLGFRCVSRPESEAEPRHEFPHRSHSSAEQPVVSPMKTVPSLNNSAAAVTSQMLDLRSESKLIRNVLRESCTIKLETDCEILSLEQAPPPPWAVASGRDRYGLWAEFELKRVRQRLRWIPPGQFLMGSATKPDSSWIDERLQHPVTLTYGFWMFDTPCTQQLWNVSGLPSKFRFMGDQRPVESVSFEQVVAFVEHINTQVTEVHLRLPTEAEWEYSCRAGHPGDRYGELDDIAWFEANSDGHTQDVKQKQPNAWGLYEMLGNVWEWCLDGPRNYTQESAKDPLGESFSRRVVRGGGWSSPARNVRAANRDSRRPAGRHGHLGFRCLSSPEPSPESAREVVSGSESLHGGSPEDGGRISGTLDDLDREKSRSSVGKKAQ